MTDTNAGEPPLPGLGEDGNKARQALRTVTENERGRRYERDRAPRSETRAATQDDSLLARLANPPVRKMYKYEEAGWDPEQDRSAVYTRRRGGPAEDIAGAVRRRREESGRGAWSEAKDADLERDRVARLARPDVEDMTPDQKTAWEERHKLSGQEPGDAYITHRTDGPAGMVSVTVGPCLQRWGLEANGTTPDGQPIRVLVSCANPAIAKQLADEIVAKGPEAVSRLQDFAAMATERAAAARNELHETEQQRLARTAAAVHKEWDQPVAEVVTGSTGPGYNLTASPAFEALAQNLHELDKRGAPMNAVLRSIDDRRLADPKVENPAALAAHLVKKQKTPRLKAIDDNLQWIDNPAGTDQALYKGLDPHSAIDRVAMEATLGLGSEPRNARLIARLGEASARAHAGTANDAQAPAEGHQQDAGRGRGTPDDPDIEQRNEQTAASKRAATAERGGRRTAPAERAELTYSSPFPPPESGQKARQAASPHRRAKHRARKQPLIRGRRQR